MFKNTEKTRVRATSPGSERYQHEGTVTKKATKKETSKKNSMKKETSIKKRSRKREPSNKSFLRNGN